MSFSRSYPQYLTRAKATFDSSGGRLTAEDSNVAINVESGAVPNGVSQKFYFGVVYDDTLLLRDIPETSQRSLISPVIKCGPEDIDLLKPVEIILPHCLYMDEVKKSWVRVFRCRQFSEKGAFFFQNRSSHGRHISVQNDETAANFVHKNKSRGNWTLLQAGHENTRSNHFGLFFFNLTPRHRWRGRLVGVWKHLWLYHHFYMSWLFTLVKASDSGKEKKRFQSTILCLPLLIWFYFNIFSLTSSVYSWTHLWKFFKYAV